ncbi:MAG: terpene cyclase/mutase family protein, partial [Planctomycetia bacterium]|nr:terpene cyclase/mutase family protein [Planctomycetia bacterium]
LLLVAALLGDVPVPAESVQAAIGKSLEFLEDEGLAWKNDRKCASCHHVPMMIWSFNEARRAGYSVNGEVLSELTRYTLTDAAAKVFPDPDPPAQTQPAAEAAPGAQAGAVQPVPRYVGLQLSAVFTALAIESQPQWDDTARDAWNRIATHARDKQTLDGSWAGPGGRGPILDQTEGVTALGILTMIPPAANAANVADLTAVRAKALEWLDARQLPGMTHQAVALRLLAATRLGRPANELAPLIAEILRRQNSDGGWRQTWDRPSDAFATGQSLYVLKAAGVGSDHPALQKAIAWLLKTQGQDGSWQMVSRPVVGAPSNDKPNNTGPISYSATAWATMGLARAVPK